MHFIHTRYTTMVMNKILLLEDDQLESRLYEKLFISAGFEVYKLQTGENCREAAMYFHPNVILMDLFMPVVNGFEALDLLHFSADTKHIPVIVLTNIADSDKEKEAYRRGATMFITKSNIENSELIRQVNLIISSQDAPKK